VSCAITISGRLGAEPELRFSPAGKAVAKFVVVESGRRKNGDKWEDVDTSWWRCVAFGQIAENVAESCRKGDAVILAGKIKQVNWETREGEKRSGVEVTVDDIGISMKWTAAKSGRMERGQSDAYTSDPWTT
jgi:single-strand DNA-binding protein